MPPTPDDRAAPPPFLDKEPAVRMLRGLSTLLIGVVVAAFVLAVVVELPESVESEFVLVPRRGASPVRAPGAGVVEQVNVVAGQPVEAGAPLFAIRSDSRADRLSERRRLQTQIAGSDARVANEVAELHSRQEALRAEQARQEEQVAELQHVQRLAREAYRLKMDVVKTYEGLYEEGLVSRNEWRRYQLLANDSQVELQRAGSDLAEVQARLERSRHEWEALAAERRERERLLGEQMELDQIRLSSLQFDQEDRDQLPLSAPCSGSVVRVQVQAAGSFVERGDVLLEIACDGEDLQARIDVPPSDAAMIESELPVKLLYDAFPHQRFGVRYGTVRWISPAAVAVEGRPVFRALADIDDTHVAVRGKQRALKAGMGGTARILIGRRSVISFVLEPLRQLRQSMEQAPARQPAREPGEVGAS